ncbi:hypothetical protein SAMN04488115_104168 [Bosea lathyri]|uniref:HdeA/HdeB family protein n=2 Tax=Bosea lathyri TaxID=1036778 RepID=A0A1H5YZ38_9HYPH|nr:hypothetical protein SAMN04488115_104168 [Bosea lathyri]
MRRLLSTLFLMVATGAVAQAPVIAGPGMVSCAEFAEAYRRNPGPTEIQFFAWAQGYMSATNEPMRVRNEPTRNLIGIPTASQKQRLRAFCDQRPLANFYQAVRNLYESLPENPPKSN